MKGFGLVTIKSSGYAALCSKQTIQLADGECFSFSQLSRAAKRRCIIVRQIPRNPAPDPAKLADL